MSQGGCDGPPLDCIKPQVMTHCLIWTASRNASLRGDTSVAVFVMAHARCAALQMHHQQNSPLVLCDACPRSYHAMCLELDFHQLPEEGEWACPKCIEKETKQARREGRTIGWVDLDLPTAALHDTPSLCIRALRMDISVR